MPVKPSCELVVRKILPTLRAAIVKRLIKEYGMKQTEVSEALGLTQSAVSQYVNQSRGKHKEILTSYPEIEEFARKTATKIYEGRISAREIDICKPCQQIRKKREVPLRGEIEDIDE